MSPKGPYKLVTVNTAPDRARRLIGRVVEDLKEQYTIQHLANCESKSPPKIRSGVWIPRIFVALVYSTKRNRRS